MENKELNNLFETNIERFARTFIEDILGKNVSSEMDYHTFPDAEGFRIDCQSKEGGEGDGAEMWIIMSCKRLSDGLTKYVRFEGYYSSWDASEMDPNPTEVFAKRVIRDEWLSEDEMRDLKDRIYS
jgi:hypothetical protein